MIDPRLVDEALDELSECPHGCLPPCPHDRKNAKNIALIRLAIRELREVLEDAS